jgi:hypothetical protein
MQMSDQLSTISNYIVFIDAKVPDNQTLLMGVTVDIS